MSSGNTWGALFSKWEIVSMDAGFGSNQIQIDLSGTTDIIMVYKGLFHFNFLFFCQQKKLCHATFIHFSCLSLGTSFSLLKIFSVSSTIFNNLRVFWPYYLLWWSKKSTDTFWRVFGIIGGDNKSYQNIYSVVGKMCNESTRTILLQTLLKGDLSH